MSIVRNYSPVISYPWPSIPNPLTHFDLTLDTCMYAQKYWYDVNSSKRKESSQSSCISQCYFLYLVYTYSYSERGKVLKRGAYSGGGGARLFWGYLEVKCNFFEIIVVQWISCGTKEKVSLQLYSTHPKVNFGTWEVIWGHLEVKCNFFFK